MKTKRVLVLIDQATRDALSQLLIVKYLVRKGLDVRICNQHTLIAMMERFRPHVAYVSWVIGGPWMDYLLRNHHKAKIALIDQEGGRMGAKPFKRSFELLDNGVKEAAGKICDKVFVWGSEQACWLSEMGIVPDEQIVVTGSARFDPYLINSPSPRRPYLGVTLRGDTLTTSRTQLMENVFQVASRDWHHGIGIGYPVGAQYEDKIWHTVASTRYLFKTALAFSKTSRTQIVFRPGPWEQYKQYAFLPRRIPSALLDPHTLQHEYVRNAFALLDESSSMGLEGLLAGIPVISVQALIPRLAEHISGEGGGLFSAPYMECYWRPKSVEEAVDLLLQAEQGKLAVSPRPDILQQYLKTYHGWPRCRPSSFQIGDELLELAESSRESRKASVPGLENRCLGEMERRESDAQIAAAITDGKIMSSLSGDSSGTGWRRDLKKYFYRHVPGSVHLLKAKVFCEQSLAADREVLARYHYSRLLYRHHHAVESMFESLWNSYEVNRKAGQDVVPGPGDDRESIRNGGRRSYEN